MKVANLDNDAATGRDLKKLPKIFESPWDNNSWLASIYFF